MREATDNVASMVKYRALAAGLDSKDLAEKLQAFLEMERQTKTHVADALPALQLLENRATAAPRLRLV